MASAIMIRAKIAKKEMEKGRYRERIAAVTRVQADIPEVSEDYVTKINKKIDNASDEIEKAVKGISHIASFQQEMEARKESIGLKDSYLADASSMLDSEISDCNKKIKELEEEISDLWTQYYQAIADE